MSSLQLENIKASVLIDVTKGESIRVTSREIMVYEIVAIKQGTDPAWSFPLRYGQRYFKNLTSSI
jgi:antitoxin (DNA-binding transcriptional repressor) of toxin-antitoxin stability system